MTIRLSIITAVRNSQNTIRDCIESVRNQTYPAEHIIIDGRSSDGTLDVIHEYTATLAALISEPDKGFYDAINKGLEMAKGEVIGILNADDAYASDDILAKVAAELEDKMVDSCYGDLVYIDGSDMSKACRYWRSKPFKDHLFYRGWMPPHPTFFVRKSVYERFGTFNLGLGTAADYELMLRFLVKHKITTAYIPKTLVKMRTGGLSNKSVAARIEANRMDRLAWEVNGLKPYPWTLYLKPISKVGQWLYPYLHRKGTALNVV